MRPKATPAQSAASRCMCGRYRRGVESQKLERLSRTTARPAISEKRLSLSPQVTVRYPLKTPCKNGTTHLDFEPVDCIGKLAALVPLPRAHLIRFHGVFALNANPRAQVTPSGRGKRPPTDQESTGANIDHRSPDEKCRSLTSTAPQARLTPGILPSALRPTFRLFQIAPGDLVNIDVGTCGHCGGTLRIVASIEEPRPLRKARRAGANALSLRPARTACLCRVTPRRPRRRRRNTARPHEAATNPQGRARPAAGNQWEMVTGGERRAPALPKSHSRTSDPRPKPALARRPPTRETVPKGRLKFLYFTATVRIVARAGR